MDGIAAPLAERNRRIVGLAARLGASIAIAIAAGFQRAGALSGRASRHTAFNSATAPSSSASDNR
jgi:hypothetical protein